MSAQLVQLTDDVLDPQGRLLVHIEAAEVTVLDSNGDEAMVYADEAGTTVVDQPLKTRYSRIESEDHPDVALWVRQGVYTLDVLTRDGRTWTQRSTKYVGANRPFRVATDSPYAADATGAIATHTNLQAAIDDGPGTVWLGDASHTYKLGDTLTVTDPSVKIAGDDPTLDGQDIADNVVLNGRFALVASGTIGSTVAVTADVAAGALTITIASTTGLAAGNLVLLKSAQNYTDGATGSYGDRGAQHRIKSIGSGTITFTDPSFFAMASASTCTIQKITPLEGFEMSGVKILMGGNTAGHSGVQVNYAYRPTVQDCELEGCIDSGVQLTYCWAGNVEKNIIVGVTGGDPLTFNGYGVVAVQACRNCRILNNELRNCKHAVSGGGGIVVSILITVAGNNVEDSVEVGLDVHEEGIWWTFEANIVTGGGTAAINARGSGCQIIRNKVRGCATHGIWIKSFDVNADGLLDTLVKNNDVQWTGTGGSSGAGLRVDGTTDCRVMVMLVEGNTFRSNRDNNIFLQLASNVTLRGNICAGTYGSSGSDGHCVRIFGTGAATNTRCENIAIEGGRYFDSESRPFLFEYVYSLAIDVFQTVTSGTSALFINCLDTTVRGDNKAFPIPSFAAASTVVLYGGPNDTYRISGTGTIDTIDTTGMEGKTVTLMLTNTATISGAGNIDPPANRTGTGANDVWVGICRSGIFYEKSWSAN